MEKNEITKNMRKLKGMDYFKLIKILSKLKIMNKIKDIDFNTENLTGIQVLTLIGSESLCIAVDNFHLAERDIALFLSDIYGMNPDEFLELDGDVFLECLKELKNNEGLPGFFRFLNTK